MLKKIKFLIPAFLFSFLLSSFVLACPFCSDNLAKNNGGFTGGLTMGIFITIFFFLGVFGILVALVIRLMIKEGQKSDARHALLAAQEASQNPQPETAS